MNCERCGHPHSQPDWDQLFLDWRLFFQNKKGFTPRKSFDAAHREMLKHGPRPNGPKKPPLLVRLGLKIVGKDRLMKLLSSFIPGLIKNVAEEKFGKGPAKIYWFLAGKKTTVSAVIGAVWSFGHFVVIPYLAAQPEGAVDAATIPSIEGWLSYLPMVLLVLVPAGIADAGLRLEPPQKKT